MDFPWPTGHVARLFSISEPQLADRVRRGKVRPEPPVDAGRRRWWPEHIQAASRALGVPVPLELQGLLDEARR